MSAYNAEHYVQLAVESILSQSFRDFEFIIVDDGSTDETLRTLEDCAKQDRRVKILRNAVNRGLIPSLNRAFRQAEGEFIARQDADDLSMPQRLKRQTAFLDQNPHVGVVGTWMISLHEDGQKSIYKTPLTDAMIRWSLLFCSPIAHASVMIRRSLFAEGVAYNEEMRHAEDYDLWCKLSKRTQFENLPECLYVRRKHKDRVSVRYGDEQRKTSKTVTRYHMSEMLGMNVSMKAVSQMNHALTGGELAGRHQVKQVADLVLKLYGSFAGKYGGRGVDVSDVRHDAANFMARLGLRHVPLCPVTSGIVLWRALRLYRGVPLNACVAEAICLVRKLIFNGVRS
jgi:hypothetical protein